MNLLDRGQSIRKIRKGLSHNVGTVLAKSKTNKAKGQTYSGERTPLIEGSNRFLLEFMTQGLTFVDHANNIPSAEQCTVPL